MQKYRRPLYLDIVDEIKKRVDEGIYHPGEKLPPEVEFAEELGVSRSTLREALSLLEKERFVLRIHGIGSFIRRSEHKLATGFERFESLMEFIRRSGFEPQNKVLDVQKKILTEQECRKLDILQETECYHVRSVYTVDGEPVIFAKEVYPVRLFRRGTLIKGRLRCQDAIEFILKFTGEVPEQSDSSLKAVLPTQEVVEYLGIDFSVPVMKHDFIIMGAHQRPLMCGVDYFRGDWFEFKLIKTR